MVENGNNWSRKWEIWNDPLVGELREKFEELGIRAFLFDWDDTLARTYFVDGALIYHRKLTQLSGKVVEEKQFIREWFGLFENLRPILSVNPVTQTWLAKLTAKQYDLDPEHPELVAAFRQMQELIYETVPENLPGAFELVQLTKAAGAVVGVITHAEYDWTFLKQENWRGEFGLVKCIDVMGIKDAAAWLAAIQELGFEPHEVVGVGDSIGSDIMPALAAGMGHVFKVSTTWGRAKALPEGVYEVMDLREIAEILLAKT